MLGQVTAVISEREARGEQTGEARSKMGPTYRR
jgi:hypothetical protein